MRDHGDAVGDPDIEIKRRPAGYKPPTPQETIREMQKQEMLRWRKVECERQGHPDMMGKLNHCFCGAVDYPKD